MKKYTLKSLTSAVTSVMALLALSTQSVKAADTEIYQASKDGQITLMLMLDISGSMNISYSSRYDYNLGSGNGPQAGNDYRTIDTPILDRLAQLPANRPPNNRQRMINPSTMLSPKRATPLSGLPLITSHKASFRREIRA